MTRFLICDNSKCRFIMDLRVNGRILNGTQFIVKKCPDCGGSWSSTCPSCNRPLAVKVVAGRPHSVCCAQKTSASARAA